MDARRVIQGSMFGAVAGLAASWTMSKFDRAWKAASGEAPGEDEPNTVRAADAVATATVGKGGARRVS